MIRDIPPEGQQGILDILIDKCLSDESDIGPRDTIRLVADDRVRKEGSRVEELVDCQWDSSEEDRSENDDRYIVRLISTRLMDGGHT